MTLRPLTWPAVPAPPLKAAVKYLADAVATLLVLPLLGQTRLLTLVVTRDQAFQTASQALSLVPGVPGNYLRKAFYRRTLPRCGADVCIEFGTILHQPTIELGRRVYIGARCSIGECVIDDDVLVGSNVDVISGNHQHGFADPDRPIREQGGHLEKIVIGADSWLGNSSVVMANVGAGSVVAAGSVVTRDVEPRSVVAGNPARVVRQR
jgi:acetyltransferase-like isoleucine patch superfamily enzyme